MTMFPRTRRMYLPYVREVAGNRAQQTRLTILTRAFVLQEVATIVARKLWENRRTLALASNRLAVVALLQTLDRLEKGAAQRG